MSIYFIGHKETMKIIMTWTNVPQVRSCRKRAWRNIHRPLPCRVSSFNMYMWLHTSARDRGCCPGTGCTIHVSTCSPLSVARVTAVLANWSTWCRDVSSSHGAILDFRVSGTVIRCWNTTHHIHIFYLHLCCRCTVSFTDIDYNIFEYAWLLIEWLRSDYYKSVSSIYKLNWHQFSW
jgi:hypothetical protein